MKASMAEARAETMKQEREKVYAALQYAAGFHCLVEEREDCEELKPEPKEKWSFVDKKRDVSMYEMRKRKQIHDNAREMCTTKIIVKKFEKMVKAPSGRS